ncbi:hypothetical protein ACFQX6_37820 [Streptosporangium lutulentum]
MALFMILSEATELGADTALVRTAARLRALGRVGSSGASCSSRWSPSWSSASRSRPPCTSRPRGSPGSWPIPRSTPTPS